MSPALLPAFFLPLAEALRFLRLPLRPGFFPAGQLSFLSLQGQGLLGLGPRPGEGLHLPPGLPAGPLGVCGLLPPLRWDAGAEGEPVKLPQHPLPDLGVPGLRAEGQLGDTVALPFPALKKAHPEGALKVHGQGAAIRCHRHSSFFAPMGRFRRKERTTKGGRLLMLPGVPPWKHSADYRPGRVFILAYEHAGPEGPAVLFFQGTLSPGSGRCSGPGACRPSRAAPGSRTPGPPGRTRGPRCRRSPAAPRCRPGSPPGGGP